MKNAAARISTSVLITMLYFLLVITSCKKSFQANGLPSVEQSNASLSARSGGNIGINVVLNRPVTENILTELKTYGSAIKMFSEINALTMIASASSLGSIKNLPYVTAANPDAERNGAPVDAVPVSDFSGGYSTWNLDAINVTNNFGTGRVIEQDGAGVYIGVLDTGLPDSWRKYFPEERIAEEYAKSFSGGAGLNGNAAEQPNKWEHDQNSHGGHVTSTILGYKFGAAYFNGVAPNSTVIPVKVLNQNGSGWSSAIAEGIIYIANLKKNTLQSSPVIINMSLSGSVLDAVEKLAVDYAISNGVIIVAAASNAGDRGMGYPGAYEPVISVAAAGWKGEGGASNWWYAGNVPDPTDADDFYVADFSSRAKPGQYLDVTAPGVNVVGPYQLNSGTSTSYYFLSGTSMASPHVAGIVALMAQKNGGITAAEAEAILESKAIPMTEPADKSGYGFITADAALSGL